MRLNARQKSGISVFILFILGLSGYHIWIAGKMLYLEKFGRDLPHCIYGNKSDDFQVGNGTRIFLISKLQPSASNIFFLQTSCGIGRPGHFNLSSKQACSIYSAAVRNPSKKVILLYSCPLATDFHLNSPSAGLVITLLDLPNFHFVHETQTSKLFDRAFEELVPNSTNTVLRVYDDDMSRFLVVYVFGGTYINMDLINIRQLDNLGVNFISAESEYSTGNTFFNFEPKHRFLKELLLMMYKLSERMTTDILTSVLRKFCRLGEHYKFYKFHNFTQCKLTVLAPSLLYGSLGAGSSNGNLLANETTLPYEPYIISIKNSQDPENRANELKKQHCSAMYDYNIEGIMFQTHYSESNSSRAIFQQDEYLTFRKLSPSSHNIFFLETSCTSFKPNKSSDSPALSLRQACAIYSTAFYNPSKEVILIYTCHGFADISSGLVKKLFDLPNFSLTTMNLSDFYHNTLEWKMVKSLKNSDFPGQHNADILRLLVLYLYGGTYMDMDIISLKPLNDLGKNFIGAEDYHFVANGVLSFEAQHMFIKKCLEEAIDAYRPSMWSSVGPLLMFSVLINHCQLEMVPMENWSDWRPFREIRHMKTCDITVLPHRTFYAIPYWEWTRFYDESEWPTMQAELQQSYIAHFWNHMGSIPVYMFGEQPYAKLAEQHCNPVFEYAHKKGCFYLE